MKKINLKIFSVLVIFFGLLVIHGDVYAACNNDLNVASFTPITVNRTGPKPVFTSTVTISNSTCSGVISPNFYEFTLSHTNYGFDDWTDESIPDSVVSLKYNDAPKAFSFTPANTFNKDGVYEIRLKEEDHLPDTVGAKQVFWIDKADFGYIDIRAGSITSTGAQFDGTVTYQNKAAQVDNRSVPNRNIVARFYKQDSTFVKEAAFSNSSDLKYGVERALTSTVSDLQPNTDYYVIFLDKNRTSTDASVSKPFKTAAVSNGNGNGNGNGNNNGNGTVSTKFAIGDKVVVTGTTLNVRATANTSGTLLGSQAKDVTGTVTDGPTSQGGYNWWKIDYQTGVDGWSVEGSLEKCGTTAHPCTPTNSTPDPNVQTSTTTGANGVATTFEITALLDVSQNIANFAGIVTYGRDLTGSEWANKVGEMKVIIYKPNGDLLTLADMSVNYTSARKANIKAVVPSLDPANGPYKYVIWDRIFDAHSSQWDLKQNGQSSSATNVVNGVSINFVFSSAIANELDDTVTINGVMTYSRDLTAAEIQYKTVGKIIATVYNATGSVLKSQSGLFEQISARKFKFSTKVTGIDATNAKKFIVKDSDFLISSDEFDLDRIGGGGAISFNAAYAAESKTVGSTTVTFTDPVVTGTASSVSATSSVLYADTTKTGTVAVANKKIAATLFTVNSQGEKVFNKEQILTPTVNYNQAANLPITFNQLDSTKTYAVQFIEQNYNDAKSLAKVFQSINGTFAPSINQPGNPTNPGNPGNPGNPANPANPANPGTPTNNVRGILHSPLRDGLDSIPGIVNVLVDDIVIPIAVPLLALAIIYTGFLFVQARGNTTKLEEAKKALKWTLIGGAVILGAYVIATALQSTISDIVKKP